MSYWLLLPLKSSDILKSWKMNPCCLVDVNMQNISLLPISNFLSIIHSITMETNARLQTTISSGIFHQLNVKAFHPNNYSKSCKWMTIIVTRLQRGFSPRSARRKPIGLFTQTSERIITRAGWPTSTPRSRLVTVAKTVRVIWCQLIHDSKRLLIRSQVRVCKDSFVGCCLQLHMQEPTSDHVPGHLVQSGFK